MCKSSATEGIESLPFVFHDVTAKVLKKMIVGRSIRKGFCAYIVARMDIRKRTVGKKRKEGLQSR